MGKIPSALWEISHGRQRAASAKEEYFLQWGAKEVALLAESRLPRSGAITAGMLGIAVIDKHMIFTKRCTVGDMNLEGEIKIQADNLGKKSRCGIQNS